MERILDLERCFGSVTGAEGIGKGTEMIWKDSKFGKVFLDLSGGEGVGKDLQKGRRESERILNLEGKKPSQTG